MSKSILSLIKSLESADLDAKQDKISNPDIPEFQQMDHTENVRDNFHLAAKFNGYPRKRNGSGYYLNPQGKRVEDMMDPRKNDFLNEKSIDPNIIRSKIDPDSALPSLSSQSLHSLMPASVQPPRNQENLIKQAHTSVYNWRNRFNPARVPTNDRPDLMATR
jgi:hypothetical protein